MNQTFSKTIKTQDKIINLENRFKKNKEELKKQAENLSDFYSKRKKLFDKEGDRFLSDLSHFRHSIMHGHLSHPDKVHAIKHIKSFINLIEILKHDPLFADKKKHFESNIHNLNKIISHLNKRKNDSNWEEVFIKTYNHLVSNFNTLKATVQRVCQISI